MSTENTALFYTCSSTLEQLQASKHGLVLGVLGVLGPCASRVHECTHTHPIAHALIAHKFPVHAPIGIEHLEHLEQTSDSKASGCSRVLEQV